MANLGLFAWRGNTELTFSPLQHPVAGQAPAFTFGPMFQKPVHARCPPTLSLQFNLCQMLDWCRLPMNPPSGRQSVLFFLLSEQIFLCQPTSHSPPLQAPLHSQRIRVEVSEQSLQAVSNLLVRGPIGEGALPQHRIVAQFHRALPIGVAFLERALKSVDRIKLHFRSDLRVT